MENYNRCDIKCISITSNNDNEGKTTIAKNLAMSLAIYGKKTLFISCSSGNNTKIESFDIDSAKGIINILRYIGNLKTQQLSEEDTIEISLKNYIEKTQYEYLSIASLGEYKLDSYSIVFKTEYLQVVIQFLKKKFDYIIIDAPSFNNLSYTQIITGATDGCLFVLKEGVNEVTEGGKIKDKINTINCRVLGCILNKEKYSTKLFGNKNNSFINVRYSGRKEKVIMKKSAET